MNTPWCFFTQQQWYTYCNMKLARHWQLETSRVVAFQGDTFAVLQVLSIFKAYRVLITYGAQIHDHYSYSTWEVKNSTGMAVVFGQWGLLLIGVTITRYPVANSTSAINRWTKGNLMKWSCQASVCTQVFLPGSGGGSQDSIIFTKFWPNGSIFSSPPTREMVKLRTWDG